MTYHPYFRGKQYELLCVKENAELISRSGFCPIIEPVKNDIGSMLRCLEELAKVGASAYVLANPSCGQLKGGLPPAFEAKLTELIAQAAGLSWIYRTEAVVGGSIALEPGTVALLHDSYQDASVVKSATAASGVVLSRNIFVDGKDSGVLYRRSFASSFRVLIQDGFRKRKNADYLESSVDHFSDLHLTFRETGMDGFGDFLTVGQEYSESGGPAYAVAIHLTFLDEDVNSSLFVRHFVSDSNATPADPAGKFGEALAKLVVAVNEPYSKFRKTDAVVEFLDLHARGHYPGLGYVKKLSMQHHLELMAEIEYD